MPDNNNEIVLDVQGGASADVTLNVQRSAGGGIEMTIDPVAHKSYVDAMLALKADKANSEFTGCISLYRSTNEGYFKGNGSIAVGSGNVAAGGDSSVFGYVLLSYGENQHVVGKYNDPLLPDLWEPGHSYAVGDDVTYMYYTYPPGGGIPIPMISCFKCKTANSDETFTSSHWNRINGIDRSAFAEMVGNGTNSSNRSNARLLDWSGNEFLAGDLYVQCNSDGTGGNKVFCAEDVASEAETQAMINDYYGGGS